MARGSRPQEASQNAKSVAFRGYFFVFSPFLISSPLPSSTSILSHFSPPLPFPKDVNKKLSYRGQNAFSVVKHTNAVPTAIIHCIYPYAAWSRLSGHNNVLDLSLRPFVCPFVCLLPTCELYTSKTNEPISMQIDINVPPEQGHDGSTSGVRR